MAENDLTAYEEQHRTIREEFKKQAANWGQSETISPHLHWVVERLPLQAHFEVLDVAAGTGLLGRAIAPYVKSVTAIDLTPEMLAQGRSEAERDKIANIIFELGAAEDLPYPKGSFDMVVTRFSVHHFKRPEAALREMARVCRAGGSVAVIDIVAPEDEELAARYNQVERMRDASHTQALSPSALQSAIADAGLEISSYDSREVENVLSEWLDFAHAKANARQDITKLMQRDLIGLGASGMRPFLDDDKIMFMHTWGVVVGKKVIGDTAAGKREMKLRLATTADIDAMSEIRLSVSENVLSNPARITYQMYEDYLEKLGRGWVCEIDGELVGFAYAALADSSIWGLFVRPGYEGLGVGTRLLKVAADWLFSLGNKKVTLSTQANTRADRFYQAQGWERGDMKDEIEVIYTLHHRDGV